MFSFFAKSDKSELEGAIKEKKREILGKVKKELKEKRKRGKD